MSERVKSARITSERAMSSRMRVRRQPNVEVKYVGTGTYILYSMAQIKDKVGHLTFKK